MTKLLHCFQSQNYFYTAWGESYKDAARRLDLAGKIHPTLKKTFMALAYTPIEEHFKMLESDIAYRAEWGGGPTAPKLEYWRKYRAYISSRPDVLAQSLQRPG
jgi:hypothetical protein